MKKAEKTDHSKKVRDYALQGNYTVTTIPEILTYLNSEDLKQAELTSQDRVNIIATNNAILLQWYFAGLGSKQDMLGMFSLNQDALIKSTEFTIKQVQAQYNTKVGVIENSTLTSMGLQDLYEKKCFGDNKQLYIDFLSIFIFSESQNLILKYAKTVNTAPMALEMLAKYSSTKLSSTEHRYYALTMKTYLETIDRIENEAMAKVEQVVKKICENIGEKNEISAHEISVMSLLLDKMEDPLNSGPEILKQILTVFPQINGSSNETRNKITTWIKTNVTEAKAPELVKFLKDIQKVGTEEENEGEEEKKEEEIDISTESSDEEPKEAEDPKTDPVDEPPPPTVSTKLKKVPAPIVTTDPTTGSETEAVPVAAQTSDSNSSSGSTMDLIRGIGCCTLGMICGTCNCVNVPVPVVNCCCGIPVGCFSAYSIIKGAGQILKARGLFGSKPQTKTGEEEQLLNQDIPDYGG